MSRAALVAWLVLAGGVGHADAPPPYVWSLPPGFPIPVVPADNPMSESKVALGQKLFADGRLSATGDYSCASCHVPRLAFTDGRRTAIGATGELHSRNTPSLYNVTWAASLGWADPDVTVLERQHLVPMFNIAPVELGLTRQNLPLRLEELNADPVLRRLFVAAFPDEAAKGIGLEHVTRAIAAYVRTLVSGNSAYDRYLYFDERERLDPEAKRGLDLFFSEALDCSTCHASFAFSGPVRHAGAPKVRPVFHNTGLYNVNGRGDVPDRGLALHTHRKRDTGAFRAPSLRNVALTAPYMHDGSIATLEEVIDFYARGGRLTKSGPLAGDGRTSPYKRAELRGFVLGPGDRAALIAFLECLTELEPIPGASESARGSRMIPARLP